MKRVRSVFHPVLAVACGACGGAMDTRASEATGLATATVGDTDGASSSNGSPTSGGPGPGDTGSSEVSTVGPGGDSSSSSGSMSADTTGLDDSSSTGDAPPANLFQNPSLEDWPGATEPNVAPALWTDCSSGGLAVDAVPDSCDAQPAVASDGARYARAYDGEGIAQTIATTPGATYSISFDYCAVDGCFGGAASSRWDVLVDDVVVLSTASDVGTVWTAAQVTFEAQTASTTICVRKLADGGQGGLDNLAISEP